MPEPAAASARTGPGPSATDVVPHGLRARAFGLLPEERAAEWAAHVAGVRAGLRPRDALEEQLATAFAAASWQEIRADRSLVETMAEIAPVAPGRSHGSDFAERHHAAAMGTAVRFMAAAGMATQRAQRMFLAHRKAVRDGLLPEPAPVAVPAAANQNRGHANDTCEPDTWGYDAAADDTCEPDAPTLGQPIGAAGAADGLDDAAWVAALPAVEADPEREARRKAALLQIEPKELIRAIGHAPLHDLEQYLVAGDPVAYEEWFARQPKPPRIPAKSLGPEDAALVDWVTRHNPPWLKGEYLSYWRPPVPAHLFLPGATDDTPPPVRPAALAAPLPALPPPPEDPLPALRARLDRLLDRGQQRLPEELDLAEAVCAVKWPNWPAYRGAIDLGLLRLVLAERTITPATLHWLDSHAFAKACREGGVSRT